MKLTLLCWLLLLGGLLSAAETPTITVTKSDKLTIAIGKVDGADAALTAKLLANDLTLSGFFSIVPAERAQFIVNASTAGNSLAGHVNDHSGKVALNQSFDGSARARAHRFADEIVETLTGNHGIASCKIAFVSTRSGKKEIYTADIDGAEVVQLTHDNAISVAPSLSPDGRRLVYTGYQSGYADVYEIELGSGARQRIIKYPGTNSGAHYSPDGRRLAVTLSKDGNPELYVTSSGGGGAHRLTHTPGVESSPTWSPDGEEIIYSSDDRGGPQLFRISASGGSGRPLSTGHGYNTSPSWSPDGKKVAFTVREGGGFQVAVMDAGGGSSRILGEGQDPAWGADSRHLIFASGGSIILLDTQTGQRSSIISGLGRASEPSCSR